MARMLFDKLAKFIGRTTVGQRTARIQIRYQHFLVRTKNLCRLTHKMNTAHHNDISIRLRRPLCQCQTIAYKIGDILYFTRLVVMSQDKRILFLTQLVDLRFQIQSLVYRLSNIPCFQPFFFIHYIYIFSPSFKKRNMVLIIVCSYC